MKKTIDKFISLTDSFATSDSLNIVARDKNGNVKAVRDVSDIHELAADFNKDKLKEKYITKRKTKAISKREIEIQVVNRFLPLFNKENHSQFQISSRQPISDSNIDVSIEDVNLHKEVGLQIRVSDDEAWKDSNTKDFFERSGTGFKIYHDAIKKAIEGKLKYPSVLRKEMILLLDGWPAVRPEDLRYFRNVESVFMRKTEYREIWFVGGLPETIIKLHL